MLSQSCVRFCSDKKTVQDASRRPIMEHDTTENAAIAAVEYLWQAILEEDKALDQFAAVRHNYLVFFEYARISLGFDNDLFAESHADVKGKLIAMEQIYREVCALEDARGMTGIPDLEEAVDAAGESMSTILRRCAAACTGAQHTALRLILIAADIAATNAGNAHKRPLKDTDPSSTQLPFCCSKNINPARNAYVECAAKYTTDGC
jgi:hypothetical protein